jgi:hypothetical protein
MNKTKIDLNKLDEKTVEMYKNLKTDDEVADDIRKTLKSFDVEVYQKKYKKDGTPLPCELVFTTNLYAEDSKTAIAGAHSTYLDILNDELEYVIADVRELNDDGVKFVKFMNRIS